MIFIGGKELKEACHCSHLMGVFFCVCALHCMPPTARCCGQDTQCVLLIYCQYSEAVGHLFQKNKIPRTQVYDGPNWIFSDAIACSHSLGWNVDDGLLRTLLRITQNKLSCLNLETLLRYVKKWLNWKNCNNVSVLLHSSRSALLAQFGSVALLLQNSTKEQLRKAHLSSERWQTTSLLQ